MKYLATITLNRSIPGVIKLPIVLMNQTKKTVGKKTLFWKNEIIQNILFSSLRMISKKKNYNKKIAPFKYEEETREYIPANIVVSITLR